MSSPTKDPFLRVANTGFSFPTPEVGLESYKLTQNSRFNYN